MSVEEFRMFEPDGCCNQCAEVFGKEPTLRDRTPVGGPSVGVVCSGCGITTVNCTGACMGHNHGVDLRRLREHSVELHHRMKRLDRLAEEDPDLDGVLGALANLMSEAGYHSLAARCRPEARTLVVPG